MKKLNRLILFILLTLFSIRLYASEPVVKARMDSDVIVMGRMSTIELSVTHDNNVRGRFPIFSMMQDNGIIPLCGDSIELRAPIKSDTLQKGNQLTINYTIPIQSFDSGSYKLPAIDFIVGIDTFKSNILTLKVLPVKGVTADTQIADYSNVADPENPSIFDSLPDWVINYWWIILAVAILLAIFIALFIRYKKTGYIIPPKPEPTPYEEAMNRLNQLKEHKLWEQGLEKEYYTQLTDILRNYIYRRYGINANEMTSREILNALGQIPETKDKRKGIRQMLTMADFVKFAKVRPLPADNVSSMDSVRLFVEETKPVIVIDEASGAGNKLPEAQIIKKGGKK